MASGVRFTRTPPEDAWLKRTWARCIETTYTYNPAGQIDTVDYSDTAASPDVRYVYDHRGYLEANRRMVIAIRASGIKPRAFLIQDYHFYPLPALLRKVFPETPILHYTHIPFPDPATLKLIPQYWRDTILKGLLGADVVGMQTQWDCRPFLGCCEELLGARVDYASGTVLAPDGRIVRVRAFPASTDPAEIQRRVHSPAANAARQDLASHLDKLSIIRVDRLDPSKNQIIGFQAFGRLLEMRPDFRGGVRFLAFLVPSRTDLTVYRDYRNAVYQTIEEVNRRFTSECGFEPIQVFYANDREQALAAMGECDVLLANSREDGMNLVVKEWAVVSNRPGVAIISETAGWLQNWEPAHCWSPRWTSKALLMPWHGLWICRWQSAKHA